MANLVDVVRFYIDKMLREVMGMKVLLVDAETLRAVSTVYSQSEILEHEVYLVERLDADKNDSLFHLKARGRMPGSPWARPGGRRQAGGVGCGH